MEWDEFCDLVSGLNETTPLVRVAQIRTESDPETIKRFSMEQRAMRREWQRKKALKRPSGETESFLKDMQTAVVKMFGEG